MAAARRLALLAWRLLGQRQIDMAAALGISDSGASALLSRRPRLVSEIEPEARDIALDTLSRLQ